VFGFAHHAVGRGSPNQTTAGRASPPQWQCGGILGNGARRSGQLAPQTVQRILQISPWSLRIRRLPARSCKPSTFWVDEGEPRFAGFQLRQGQVRRVGRRLGDQLAPPVVPLPHQARVAREGFGRGQSSGL